jgi:hypothetical protein
MTNIELYGTPGIPRVRELLAEHPTAEGSHIVLPERV